jgi:hypothetical protein
LFFSPLAPIDDEEQAQDEENMFVLSWDRFNPAGVDPTGPEVKIAWRVRWMMDVQRLLVVYVPDVRSRHNLLAISLPPPDVSPTLYGVTFLPVGVQLLPSFTEFFSLLESQKNLRRTYLDMQTDLQHIIEENVPQQSGTDYPAPTLANMLRNSFSRAQWTKKRKAETLT